VCGIVTINAGCRRRRKERKRQRVGVSKMKGRGASEENGEAGDKHVEYGLPPPRRIKQRRDWKVAEE
jgi:hypothetical protein